ncbi:hypothetical protein AVEN_114612-1 [Araneus ventricosus]|uniref:Uncharacterized protein n=1 Tax=Araneus ventricosus TaxID=182803 RepID=A0A4Y2GBA0_ARAVE|nr:hypothetical protein AVEN_114612-1 [Araneus ventricosus]
MSRHSRRTSPTPPRNTANKGKTHSGKPNVHTNTTRVARQQKDPKSHYKTDKHQIKGKRFKNQHSFKRSKKHKKGKSHSLGQRIAHVPTDPEGFFKIIKGLGIIDEIWNQVLLWASAGLTK